MPVKGREVSGHIFCLFLWFWYVILELFRQCGIFLFFILFRLDSMYLHWYFLLQCCATLSCELNRCYLFSNSICFDSGNENRRQSWANEIITKFYPCVNTFNLFYNADFVSYVIEIPYGDYFNRFVKWGALMWVFSTCEYNVNHNL